MTYPITVEIINKANNEVLLQRTTTTSNIEFGFKASITGAAEVKIYLRNPVTGTVPEYNLTYAKLSKAAYNFPASVPAYEMEVVSNFNVGERSDGGSFDLPINNAGWVGNSNTNLVGIWESSNNDIGVMIANNPNANVSLSKTLFLGAGSYTFSLFDYFESVEPFWQQLERNGSFNNARLYNVIISGTGVGTITGRTNFETTEEGQLISDITFNVNTACNVTINIQGFDDTHTLAFGSLNLYKTVPAATPETNSWASSNYRYGFNTQQKQDDIYGPGNQNTALYWEYDTRLGRRWNLDPIVSPEESGYATNRNNPILLNDPNGDCPDCPEGETGDVHQTDKSYGHVGANGDMMYIPDGTNFAYVNTGKDENGVSQWKLGGFKLKDGTTYNWNSEKNWYTNENGEEFSQPGIAGVAFDVPFASRSSKT